MDIYRLTDYFGLKNVLEKIVDEGEFYSNREELYALHILDAAVDQKLSYDKALETCFVCKPFLALNKKGLHTLPGPKDSFGKVLYTATLALQTQIGPEVQLRVKNKQALKTYLPVLKNLEDDIQCKVVSDKNLRALIRLAMILDYDCGNLALLFRKRFPDKEIFVSAFD